MSNPYRKYDGFSYREIGWRLRRQQIPEPIIQQTIANIKEWRAVRTKERRQERERAKAWGEVISALQHERRIVRSMVRYKTASPAPERDEFVQDYFTLLNTLYERLLEGKNLTRDDSGKRIWPKHSHWTDFVPDKIKRAFKESAGLIPPRQKAKFKEPFQRADPKDLRDLRHGRLLRHIRKELLAVKQSLVINPDNERAQRKLHALETASIRAKDLEDNAHVPNHWADLVPELLVKNQTDDDDDDDE